MRRDYLSKLVRAARWYLPPAEAAEVLEDYREIVEGRTEEELRRDLGMPRAAMRQLAQPGAYRRWLAVFAVLTVCIVLPAITPLWQELSFNVFKWYQLYWFWDIGARVIPFIWVFFAVGMALSLMWLRRGNGKEPGRVMPKGIWPLLLLFLAGMAWMWFLGWTILMERWDILNFLAPDAHRAVVLRLVTGADILAIGMLGLFGLVKSRLTDRRWGAVYVLGLAGVILGLSVWGLFTSLDLSAGPGWQNPLLLRYGFVTAAGLVGTAVALC